MERTENKGERRKNKIKNITYMSTGVFSWRRENKIKRQKEKEGQSERDGQQRRSSSDLPCLSMRGNVNKNNSKEQIATKSQLKK